METDTCTYETNLSVIYDLMQLTTESLSRLNSKATIFCPISQVGKNNASNTKKKQQQFRTLNGHHLATTMNLKTLSDMVLKLAGQKKYTEKGR